MLESVRKDHVGLHSFLSMHLIDARRRNARPRRLRFSQSLARRLHRPSHANVRSIGQDDEALRVIGSLDDFDIYLRHYFCHSAAKQGALIATIGVEPQQEWIKTE